MLEKLEKIVSGILVGTALSLMSCTKEEQGIGTNQQIIRESSNSEISDVSKKVPELKKLYAEREYKKAGDIAKEILMKDEKNPEANVILLFTKWIERYYNGKLEEEYFNSSFSEFQIVRTIQFKIRKKAIPLLEAGIQDKDFSIMALYGHGFYTRGFDIRGYMSTFNDEIKRVIAGIYLTLDEANELKVSLIDNIQKDRETWVEFNKDDKGDKITLEGEIIGYETKFEWIKEEGRWGQKIGEHKEPRYDYFVLQDKFGKRINVIYKNKRELNDFVKVTGKLGYNKDKATDKESYMGRDYDVFFEEE